MSGRRTLVWVSAGAASAIAAKLILSDRPATLAYCDTGAEDPDNARFLLDLEKWFGQAVTRLKSEKYADTWDVWERRKYLAGIDGAPCTVELKVSPRLLFQRPDDAHVFGYTANARDVERAALLRATYPELTISTPLIERGLTKAACLAMLEGAGVQPPRTYALGFPNANCIPCPKATSPNYYALVRKHYPEQFARLAALSRTLDARLTRLKGVRSFIDEIPADHPTTNPLVPSCDFLCVLSEQDLESAA